MLRLLNISYSYPYAERLALEGISLHVRPGELLLCTGESGCGKSTLIRVLNGLAPHYMQGTLYGKSLVNGVDTVMLSPAELAMQAGSLFQEPERQFFALTVGEEIAFSLQWRGWDAGRVSKAITDAACRLGIEALLGQSIFGLSEGQKQKVALAALLAAKPKALLLDEPSANLDPESSADLAGILSDLKDDGLAILVVDHRLHWLRDVVDSVLVLREGREEARGNFSLFEDSSLRETCGLRAPFLEDPRELLPDTVSGSGADFFRCEDLSFAYSPDKPIFTGLCADFIPGGICALIGDNGVGKTTLARLCTGLEKPSAGRVLAHGLEISRKKLPRHAQVVLQNAGHQLRMRSVREELADAALGTISGNGELCKAVSTALERYGLSALEQRHPQSLSGGEKQRLAVACATIRKPEVLFLDEPTSGLDGRNMRRMAESMRQAAADGAAVIVITHDLELMSEVCAARMKLLPHEV